MCVCLVFLKIIKKTRFPHWGETLELELEMEELTEGGIVTLEVWDWDMVGKNDFLGKVTTLLFIPNLSPRKMCVSSACRTLRS